MRIEVAVAAVCTTTAPDWTRYTGWDKKIIPWGFQKIFLRWLRILNQIIQYTGWDKKIIPWGFQKIFLRWLRILNQIIHQLYVHIYAKLQNFIQLSTKHDYPENFHFSQLT